MNTYENAIDVRGLNKYFGEKHVVKDLSLQVGRGEILGFLGPNGSGKTTAIRMLCGLLTPDSGEGHCLGYDIRTQSDAIKREAGYMTQKFSYWEDLSIRENLDFVARVYELANRKHVVDEALETLGLTSRSSQLARSLSGGWKQRLALAACMLRHPKLLLLDEPTAGVDPNARRDFWEELHELASQGVSVLISTHYMDEAERCHKLAYIAYGNLLAQGSAKNIIEAQKLFTYEVIGDRLMEISKLIEKDPAIEQTVIFGSTLHVSGKDSLAIEEVLKTQQFKSIPTTLEDVFIYLMKHTRDNYGESYEL
ncbi:ABC transporter ATP-binding protein [Sulfuricurvum sp.]|uniref:ABC transporter ATP-binding protein n=1 Tax=Sulfuricurvum sp. TaxID=2025608 RepID=UPI00260D2F9D|nr:ABC transporter ATP-binding protein [Sulfuricurvum sp.]MDD2266279.1 ABC transporter ATP-binding protein [Sulfuricurvum sp.]MDD2783327.1 ABC transporter ATP-binding protein [Sulfuricurvum sp.]HZF71106.1 ABC transporter ATP-binding protein [Sulfuricurvum sp.]